MSIKTRLRRLEVGAPARLNKPLYIVTRYAGETEAEARAAFPELPFPTAIDDACIIYIPRMGSRPAVRPPGDAPAYDPRGLRAVLAEIDGQTQSIAAWKG